MNYHSLDLLCAGCHHPATHTQRNIHALDRRMGMCRSGAGVARVWCLAVCGCCVRVCTRSSQQQQRPEGQSGYLCQVPSVAVCL